MEISRRVDNHIDPRIQPSPARTPRSRDADADDGARVDRDGAHVGVSGDSVQISAQASARLDGAATAEAPVFDPEAAAAAATDLAAALAAQPPAALGAQGNLSADAVMRLLA